MIAATEPAPGSGVPPSRDHPSARWTPWLAPLLIVLIAAVLRLWRIQDVSGNVFYDAAVRSMGTSWHDFFFGALEPSGTVSIDKPPIDLWLQVASTRVLGFDLVGLHLPEALGGVAACGLLFGALRRPFGFTVALVAALALAVLPVSVLTARSDTMDSVLAALEVAALWLSWRALESGRMRWSVLAAAVMGLAFNVKLAEMLIALPALALLWLWAAAPGTRIRVVLATAAAFFAVALSWTAIASLTPASSRPFPIGSANGSIWHVTLVYDGLNRLSSHGATGTVPGGAGPLRLLSAGPAQYWTLIGVALLATSLLALLALGGLLAQGRERLLGTLRSSPGRFAAGIAVWFFTGLIAFSAMERLQARYLEAFAPAVCAVFGLSLATLWRNGLGARGEVKKPRGRAGDRLLGLRVLLACVGLGVLAASLSKDAFEIRRARTDALLSDFSTPALSRYLRTHRNGARFEVVGANINDVTGLVARDGLPVLALNSVDGPLTRTKALQAQVANGRVRFYLVAPHPCHSGPHCPYNQVWAYAHSTPVGGQPGLRQFTALAAQARARPRPIGRVHTAARSPGSLPQTHTYPSGTSAQFKSLMAALWAGVVHDSLTEALPAFFPKGAYIQLKAIASASSDWTDRLVHDFGLDIAAAHALLGRDGASAQLVKVDVPSSFGHWIGPGVCYNSIGYYEMPNARIVYRESGRTRSFGIASMISWRGVWYVVHLGAILRSTDSGTVDEPALGRGNSAYSGTC